MASARVLRTTMFKVAEPANQQELLDAYKVLAQTQSKDDKPYILYMSAGITTDTTRSQGYTVVARSEFASMEDMKHYDEKCAAHAKLKETAKGLGMKEPPLVIYHTGVPAINVSER